jgi:hypothetical protein
MQARLFVLYRNQESLAESLESSELRLSRKSPVPNDVRYANPQLLIRFGQRDHRIDSLIHDCCRLELDPHKVSLES